MDNQAKQKMLPILVVIIVLLLAGIYMSKQSEPTKNPEAGQWRCELIKNN